MPFTLLMTKLHIPAPRPDVVPRPQLIARLNEALRCLVTLISAPVGFGKTTLLGTELKQLPASTQAVFDLNPNAPYISGAVILFSGFLLCAMWLRHTPRMTTQQVAR